MSAQKKRPRYDDRISKTVGSDGWSAWEWPIQSGYRLACCGCGLVHNVNFRVKNDETQLQFQINRKATAAMRRGKRYAAIKKALGG